MAPPHDTPPTATVAPATVPGQRPDEDTAHAQLLADTFIHGALDDAKRAVDHADRAVRAGDTIGAGMWLAVARSSREDAWHAACAIGRLPR
jgi:hypothetical protein